MSESQHKKPINNINNSNNSTFTTPKKTSNSRKEEQIDNHPTQGKEIQNNSIYTHHQAHNQNIPNTVSKIPTTLSLHQDGQYTIAKSIVETDSSMPNLLKSQIPQVNQYQGNPQDLVNHLTGKIFSLVEQVHKLSSIIDEMSVGQQYLSEKYLELRSIYYQMLLDNGVEKPSDENSQWLVLHQNGSKSSQVNFSPPKNQKTNGSNYMSQHSSRNQSPESQNQSIPQNIEQVKKQSKQEDDYVECKEEIVKKSLKNKEQHQGKCNNCEVRNDNELQMRQEIEQMRTNLDAQSAEIQRLRSYLNKTPVGFIEIDVYKSQNNSHKSQSVANSPYKKLNINNQHKNGIDADNVSLKDSIEVIKEYISDKAEVQNKSQKNLIKQQSPIRSYIPKQITYPQTTKNSYQQNPSNMLNMFKARNVQVDLKPK